MDVATAPISANAVNVGGTNAFALLRVVAGWGVINAFAYSPWTSLQRLVPRNQQLYIDGP